MLTSLYKYFKWLFWSDWVLYDSSLHSVLEKKTIFWTRRFHKVVWLRL